MLLFGCMHDQFDHLDTSRCPVVICPVGLMFFDSGVLVLTVETGTVRSRQKVRLAL